jgi:NADH-quinone oxidoreductase subunit L
MPVTVVTFALGYLALIGFPFLSGYYSKDAIIEAAAAQPGWRGVAMGGAAMLAAGLTAFYMTRLVLMTFFGEKRWEKLTAPDGHEYHPHESPAVMTIPMIVLAFGSVGAGFFFQGNERLAHWLSPAIGELQEGTTGDIPHDVVGIGTLVLSGLGVLIAYLVVGRRPTPVNRPEPVSLPVRAARRDLYANAINETLIARPGTWLSRALVYVDNKGVDGVVNGTAALLGGSSGRMRRLQTGFVRSYAMSMLGGTVLLVAALLAVRFGSQ